MIDYYCQSNKQQHQKTMKSKKTPNTEVAFLRSQGYEVTVQHRFVGGKENQALVDPVVIQLPSGKYKTVNGICDVTVRTPNDEIGYGTAVSIEPYNRKIGVRIALGRAMLNIGKDECVHAPKATLICASCDDDIPETDWDNGEN